MTIPNDRVYIVTSQYGGMSIDLLLYTDTGAFSLNPSVANYGRQSIVFAISIEGVRESEETACHTITIDARSGGTNGTQRSYGDTKIYWDPGTDMYEIYQYIGVNSGSGVDTATGYLDSNSNVLYVGCFWEYEYITSSTSTLVYMQAISTCPGFGYDTTLWTLSQRVNTADANCTIDTINFHITVVDTDKPATTLIGAPLIMDAVTSSSPTILGYLNPYPTSTEDVPENAYEWVEEDTPPLVTTMESGSDMYIPRLDTTYERYLLTLSNNTQATIVEDISDVQSVVDDLDAAMGSPTEDADCSDIAKLIPRIKCFMDKLITSPKVWIRDVMYNMIIKDIESDDPGDPTDWADVFMWIIEKLVGAVKDNIGTFRWFGSDP